MGCKKANSFEYWRFIFGCILLTISYLDPVPSEEYMGYDNSGVTVASQEVWLGPQGLIVGGLYLDIFGISVNIQNT